MIEFFNQVLQFLQTGFTVLKNALESLFFGVTYLVRGVQFSTYCVTLLPGILGGVGAAMIAVYVVKFLIGR